MRAPVTPERLGLLIAALLVLSMSVAIGIARYPEQERIPIAVAQQHPGLRCEQVSAHECIAVYAGNFGAKAWLMGTGTLAATILFSTAFRRRYDRT